MAEMTPEIQTRIASMVDTLRWHRGRKGWTQAQLADMLDVKPNTVAHLETGRQIPNLPRLAQWAALFDLQVGLFAEEDEEEDWDDDDLIDDEDDLDDDDLEDRVDALIIAPLIPPSGAQTRQRVAA